MWPEIEAVLLHPTSIKFRAICLNRPSHIMPLWPAK